MTDTEDQQIRKSDEIKEIIPALAYALAGCAVGTIICFLLAHLDRAQNSLAKCKEVAEILGGKKEGDTIKLSSYDIERRNKFTGVAGVPPATPFLSLDNLARLFLVATVGLLYAILFISLFAAMKRRTEDDKVNSTLDVAMYALWAVSLILVVVGWIQISSGGGVALAFAVAIYVPSVLFALQ